MNKRKFTYILVVVLLLLTGCGQSVSKDAINSINSKSEKDDIVQQLETSHFKFYSKEQDKSCLGDLSNALEENYTRITNDLKTSLDKKVDVYIYSDLSTYHKVINRPNAEKWEIASAESNTIRMINPLNIDGYSHSILMKSIVHEFVHVLERNICTEKNIPKSLDEGVAAYESGLYERVDEVVARAKSNNKFPSLKDLETDAATFGKINGYEFSYSLVQYTIKTYGYDKLIALIKAPSEFENIFGLSRDDFEKGWVAHIR